MKKVVIIIVNWNGCADTVKCLESLKNISYPDYQVVIVDNGSEDGSEQRLRDRYPRHTVIQSGSNLGFAGGVNIGIRRALEENADFILILNNDTEVSRDFLDELVRTAGAEKGIGITGGKIYRLDDRKKLWSCGGTFNINSGRARHFVSEKECLRPHAAGKPEFLYVQGCLMLIKKECVDDIGLFSERFFHLGEDVEYCVRAQKKGWRLGFAPQSVIYHRASASLRPFSPVYNYYEQRNRLSIVKEYHDYGNLFEMVMGVAACAMRVLYTSFFRTSVKDFMSNLKWIFRGVRDFTRGKFGKIPGETVSR